MPTENNVVARDERLVTLPMWIVESVRVEVTKNRQRKRGTDCPLSRLRDRQPIAST